MCRGSLLPGWGKEGAKPKGLKPEPADAAIGRTVDAAGSMSPRSDLKCQRHQEHPRLRQLPKHQSRPRHRKHRRLRKHREPLSRSGEAVLAMVRAGSSRNVCVSACQGCIWWTSEHLSERSDVARPLSLMPISRNRRKLQLHDLAKSKLPTTIDRLLEEGWGLSNHDAGSDC